MAPRKRRSDQCMFGAVRCEAPSVATVRMQSAHCDREIRTAVCKDHAIMLILPRIGLPKACGAIIIEPYNPEEVA